MGILRWPGSAGALARRSWYRVQQFALAVRAWWTPVDASEWHQAYQHLPETAWPLFASMPLNDQRHGLNVLRTLQVGGWDEPTLLQAALLHDCAKGQGGVRLWHRVAAVLVKAFRPGLTARWMDAPAPLITSWQYPMWAHVNHPAIGADLAVAAGCESAVVALIRRHQEQPLATSSDPAVDRLLAILQEADDNN
jgi:hypothetical protein